MNRRQSEKNIKENRKHKDEEQDSREKEAAKNLLEQLGI